VEIWSDCRERFGGAGNFLFGRFSIPDAFYAPVVMRLHAYAVKLPPLAQAYCEAVHELSAVKEWKEAARRETEFVPEDEPYAKK
jgi:glutathione S-transferase